MSGRGDTDSPHRGGQAVARAAKIPPSTWPKPSPITRVHKPERSTSASIPTHSGGNARRYKQFDGQARATQIALGLRNSRHNEAKKGSQCRKSNAVGWSDWSLCHRGCSCCDLLSRTGEDSRCRLFVAFAAKPGEVVSLDPIYEYLKNHGYDTEGEYVVIERSLVQFLAAGPLVEEAIAQANEVNLEGQRTFIFSAEHLVAIALQTDRAKDKARILQFIEADVLEQKRLDNILEKHELLEKWHTFQKMFLCAE